MRKPAERHLRNPPPQHGSPLTDGKPGKASMTAFSGSMPLRQQSSPSKFSRHAHGWVKYPATEKHPRLFSTLLAIKPYKAYVEMKGENMMEIGKVHSCRIQVTGDMAACNAVAGVPHVFGTPSLVTLIERTAHEAVAGELGKGATTVGCMLELSHTSPTPIGMEVECRAVLVRQEGAMLSFEVEAEDRAGRICTCKHTRAIVEKKRIEAKAAGKL